MAGDWTFGLARRSATTAVSRPLATSRKYVETGAKALRGQDASATDSQLQRDVRSPDYVLVIRGIRPENIFNQQPGCLLLPPC